MINISLLFQSIINNRNNLCKTYFFFIDFYLLAILIILIYHKSCITLWEINCNSNWLIHFLIKHLLFLFRSYNKFIWFISLSAQNNSLWKLE